MIKTGLWRAEQLAGARATKGFFGGTRRVSITLYDQVRERSDGAMWAERILFGHSDGRGIYKRTYSRRFDRFDDFALAHVAAAFAPDRGLRIHDAGVSDARTACDFFQKIAAAVPVASYCASDHES